MKKLETCVGDEHRLSCRAAALLCLSGILLTAPAWAADPYLLTSGNSSVSINAETQTGMNSWTVEGQSQLNQQWFWYSVDGNPASSLDAIPLISSQISGAVLTTTYAANQFSIEISYSLLGGTWGSGASDLAEQIKIQNLTGSMLPFHFFQFANFASGGTAQLGTGYRGLFNEALISGSSGSPQEKIDTAISPGANAGQVNITAAMLDGLTVPSGLNNIVTGSTDASWALQWDEQIAANSTVVISQDLNVTGVPEPAAASLVLAGLVGCGVMARGRGRTNEQKRTSRFPD